MATATPLRLERARSRNDHDNSGRDDWSDSLIIAAMAAVTASNESSV